jgi:hypothetical protein
MTESLVTERMNESLLEKTARGGLETPVEEPELTLLEITT